MGQNVTLIVLKPVHPYVGGVWSQDGNVEAVDEAEVVVDDGVVDAEVEEGDRESRWRGVAEDGAWPAIAGLAGEMIVLVVGAFGAGPQRASPRVRHIEDLESVRWPLRVGVSDGWVWGYPYWIWALVLKVEYHVFRNYPCKYIFIYIYII